uniref:BTB domain-containing protein n=1 Tax=Aegilops tauschii TaxID=37682 RepID=R7W874_AEGTA
MARDLLVAADLYDLERLRLMCENILSESIDVGNVMATLMLVHGRHDCWQLEGSCVKFMASEPDMYDVVQATKNSTNHAPLS